MWCFTCDNVFRKEESERDFINSKERKVKNVERKVKNVDLLVFKVPPPSLEKLEQLTQNGGSSFFAKKVWRGHQTLFLFLDNKQIRVRSCERVTFFTFLIEMNTI